MDFLANPVASPTGSCGAGKGLPAGLMDSSIFFDLWSLRPPSFDGGTGVAGCGGGVGGAGVARVFGPVCPSGHPHGLVPFARW